MDRKTATKLSNLITKSPPTNPRWPFIIGHLSFAIGHLSFAIGHLSFAICHWSLIIVYCLSTVFFPPESLAQTLSLSITPPLSEIVTEPGKENELVYTLRNEGNDVVLSPHVYPFSPSGENGNVNIEKDLLEYDPSGFSSWFTFNSPSVELGGKFILKKGDSLDVKLTVLPPTSVNQGDYYFTLIFATENDAILGNQGSTSQMKIGTNILLTVSEDGNPKKVASVVEFSAPKIIDSFLGRIDYNLRIANNGIAFFKPTGSITIQPTFGKGKTLVIAPQNIAVASTRQLYCLDKETLIPCSLSEKVLLGKYKAVLNFTIDESGTVYSKELITVAFPLYLTIAIIGIVSTMFFIIKITKKGKI